MDFSRINRTHVWIVGAVIIVLSCVLIYALFVRNVQATLAVANLYQTGMENDAGPTALSTAQKDERASQVKLVEGQAMHVNFENRNPKFTNYKYDPNNALSHWQALFYQEQEIKYVIAPLMKAAFDRNEPTLRVVSTWKFPDPPNDPKTTFATSPIVFPNAGTVNITGAYPRIQQYLETLPSKMPRIVTMGALSLDDARASNAQSRLATQWVTGSFQVSLYEFVPGVPTAGAGASTSPTPGGAAGSITPGAAPGVPSAQTAPSSGPTPTIHSAGKSGAD